MTQHDPTRRTNRQRDSRKQERRQERHTDNASLRDAVRAIGAGDIEQWQQEDGDE
ncbi:hypothetical protein [Paracoccus sp. SY]|uniref:hypothetical protein n=1 Tax=Paracoccus sp. SY TaxID=1330255 RepID=UPI001305001B|nr:hypothetical protein [Paracoccus sp. SY]